MVFLLEPERYFRDSAAGLSGRGQESSGASPQGSFYVVAEKILAGDEPLRPAWEMEGTTGYDFLNLLNGLCSSIDRNDVRSRAFTRKYLPSHRSLTKASLLSTARD